MIAEVEIVKWWKPLICRDGGSLHMSFPFTEAKVSRFYFWVSLGRHVWSVSALTYSIFHVTAGLLPDLDGQYRPYVSAHVWRWGFSAGLSNSWRPWVRRRRMA